MELVNLGGGLISKWSNLFRACWRSDLLIEMSGIKYNKANRLREAFSQSLPYIFAAITRTPSIAFTQSYGPIDSPFARKFANFALRLCRVVMSRDDFSTAFLEKLIPQKTITQYPDIAFLLEAEEFSRRVGSDYVVVSLSQKAVQGASKAQRETYMNCMQWACEFFCSQSLQVVILPHVHKAGRPSDDDVLINRELYSRLKEKSTIIDEELNPMQLKYIISRSQFLLGSRYHSLVASLSSCVPSLAVGWAEKYEGLFDLFDLKDFVLSVQSLDRSEFENKLCEALSKRDEIRAKLNQRISEVKRRAQSSVDRIIESLPS